MRKLFGLTVLLVVVQLKTKNMKLFANVILFSLPVLLTSCQKSIENRVAIDSTRIWHTSALEKVYKSPLSIKSEIIDKTIIIKSAKGEYEPFQLVLSPKRDMKDVRLEFSDLSSRLGKVKKENIFYYRVEYVDIKQPVFPDSKIGLYPDPLPVENESYIKGGFNSPFWITIKVPDNTKAGTYSGKIVLLQNDNKIHEIPLKLKVWDFAVPQKPTIKTSASLHSPNYHHIDELEIFKFEKGDKLEILKRYYKNLADHRVRVYTHGPILPDIKITVSENNKVSIDSRAFDEMAEYCINQLKFEEIKFPGMLLLGRGGDTPKHVMGTGKNALWTFGNVEIPIFANEENTSFRPEFKALFFEVYGRVCKHLDKKGWLDNVVVSIIDEPTYGDKPTLNGLIELVKLFKTLEPKLKVRVTKHPIEELKEYVDVWDVHSGHVSQGRIDRFQDQLQQKDVEINVYDNVISVIDMHGLRTRTFPWMIWKKGLNGSLSWCRVANWIENPWVSPPGGVRNLSGITKLLYPPRSASEKGPINSIRWELFREGLEDYEYLNILSHRMNELEILISNTDDLKKKERLTEILNDSKKTLGLVDTIVSGFPEVSTRNKTTRLYENDKMDEPYTKDIRGFYRVRENIAKQIETINSVLSAYH